MLNLFQHLGQKRTKGTGINMILSILSIIAGTVFTAAGVYFLTERYLQKMNDASPEKSQEILAKNKFRAKTSGYTGLGIGALTIMFGIMLILFPTIAPALALAYMVILMIACIILMVVYK